MKYISDGTWFDEGTECELLIDCEDGDAPEMHSGLFKGLHNGDVDEELCLFDEFEIIPE